MMKTSKQMRSTKRKREDDGPTQGAKKPQPEEFYLCDEDGEANGKNKTTKKKRKVDSQTESAKKPPPKRQTTWVEPTRRHKKNIDYKECKDDLNHLFYLGVKAQTRVRHTFVPNLNVGLNGIEDLMDLPKNIYPHCSMTALRPVYYVKKHCVTSDPLFGRTIAYDAYKKRLLFGRARYLNTWRSSRHIRKLAKDGVYQSTLFQLAERLEKSPDPYFYGNYDFYYTGGNLCLLPNAETHNVLHVGDARLGALKLSTYPCGQFADSAIVEEFTSTQLPTATEIFEVSSLQSMSGAQDLVSVRQKNNITILKINANRNTVKMLIDFKTKNAPLISSAQSLEKPSMLVVTNMKQSLRVYDISSPKLVALTEMYKMQQDDCAGFASCWNRIKRWHGETFLYANDHQLMFADFRAPQRDWLKTECTFSRQEYRCEINTSLALSEFEHLFYIGTTHKLRCLDERYLTQQTHYEQSTVCEWTHLLDYPPAYLDVHRDGAREFVACASHVAGDLRICELTQSKHFENTVSECAFESHCLPWQPPTLQEAYESAKLAGKLLQPEADLKNRIRASTTGLGFLKTENNPATQALLMYANSNGDVYAQSVKRRQEGVGEERTNARSNAIIVEYAENLCNLEPPALNYTAIVDLKVMRSVFLCPHLNEKPIKVEKDDANTEQVYAKESNLKQSKGSWRRSMATLRSYKDALVPDLLSIWDIPCENEIDVNLTTLQNKFKSEKSDKDILNWLNKNDRVEPTTTIPIANLNMSMDLESTGLEVPAQSTQLFACDVDISCLSTSNLMDSRTLRNSPRITPAKPKASKAKKKHVKGF